jgi:Fe-S-cluster containining protein
MAGGKCTIYERRPVNCRGFLCYNHGSQQIRDAVNAQPALRRMLREEGVLPEKSRSYDSVRAMLVRHRKKPVLQRRAALSQTLEN